MLRVSKDIVIDDRELEERFIRASGPGGQHVNKVATAVELRFDVRQCSALLPSVAARLERLAGRRLTEEGVLVIRAERFRTQERNRDDARIERTPPRGQDQTLACQETSPIETRSRLICLGGGAGL